MKKIILQILLFIFSIMASAQPILIKEVGLGTHSYVGTSNLLYYLSSDTLWRSDGTPSGTFFIKTGLNQPGNLTPIGNRLFFTDVGGSGIRLWTSTGTNASTVFIATLTEISSMNSLGNLLLFVGQNASGRELWKSDGTAGGTVMVKDINPGPGDGLFANTEMVTVNNYAYFLGYNEATGEELWKSDATTAGTTLVKDIVPGPDGSHPYRLAKAGNFVIFDTGLPVASKLMWKSDGTAAGTEILWDYGAVGYDNRATSLDINDTLYFTLTDPGGGETLLKTSGEDGDIVPIGGVEYFAILMNAGGYLIIPSYQYEEWSLSYSNKMPGGVTYITGGEWSINGTTLGNHFFYAQSSGIFDDYLNELWQVTVPNVSNVRVKDLYPFINPGFDYVSDYAVVGNTLYFTSASHTATRFLYKYTPMDFGVNSFTLVNSQTDTDIMPLKNGDTIYTDQHVNIRANTFGTVNSVRFLVNDVPFRLESAAPFALAGDNSGNYNEWLKPTGKVKITAIPYTQTGGSGTAGTPATFTITVLSPSDTIRPQISFTLVDADTDQDIGPLVDGQVINPGLLPTTHLNIRANSTLPNTESVKFDFTGTSFDRIENEAPYSLFTDINGDYKAWCCPNVGTYTLQATPYTGNQASGTAGVPANITFRIVNELQDGIYRISMKYDLNMVWDLRGGFSDDGTEVLQYPYHGGGNQQWNIQKVSEGLYTIQSIYTGKYLQVSTMDNGEFVVQWSREPIPNQLWRIESVGSGYYKVINQYSQKCADLTHVPLNNEIVQWTCSESFNQEFKFELFPVTAVRKSMETSAPDLKVEVYPNPSSDIFHISFSGDFSYKIVNSEGMLISEGNGTNAVSASLKSFPKGFYILQIKSSVGTKEVKLVKN